MLMYSIWMYESSYGQQCNTLGTSGFVDDAMFFTYWNRINQTTMCLVEFARWWHQLAAAPCTGAKSAVLDCIVNVSKFATFDGSA